MAIRIKHPENILEPSNGVLIVSGTGSLRVPIGVTANRPSSPESGMIRYNSSSDVFEVYVSSVGWTTFSQGSTNVTLSAYGTGANLFIGVSGGSEIRHRTIVGSNIEVSAGANEIIISALTQNVTLSSLGGGTSLAIGVSANREIQIRSLTAGGIIDITTSGNTVNISARQAPQTISALGGGTSNVIGVSGNELQFRTFTAGGIIDISTSGNTVNISAATFTQAPVTLSAYGTGANLFLGVSGGTELRYRTIIGSNIEVSAGANEIIISAKAAADSERIKNSNNSVSVDTSANTKQELTFITNSAVRMTITSAGRVGIGTTTPSATLHIFDAALSSSFILLQTVGTGSSDSDGVLIGISAPGLDFIIRQQEDAGIVFETNSLERMTITSGGRVGIGTTTPTETLEVLGTTKSVQIIVSGQGQSYKLPTSAGVSGQYLRTRGNGLETYWGDVTGGSVTLSAYGAGANLFLGVSGGTEIRHRTIVGSNIEVSAGANEIIISALTQNVTLSSLGGGTSLAIGVSANREIQIRSLTAGGIIDITTSGNTVNISARQAPVTLSAYGTGANLFLGVSGGTELRYRTIVGSNIEVSAGANEIVISAQVFTQNVTLSSLGGGTSLAIGVSANREVQIRSLTAGGIIDITTSGNTVNISARQSPQTLSALGGGISPVIGVSGNELQFRTFVGTGAIDIAISGNTINISAATFTQAPVTLSAYGAGANLFLGVSGGTEIRHRTIIGSNIEVSAGANEIIISALTQNVTLSSLGGGTSLAIGVSANREVQIRSLTAGGIIDITTSGNTVNISAATFTQAPVTLSAYGTGANLFLGVSGGTELRYRTIIGSNIEVSAGANEIIISALSNTLRYTQILSADSSWGSPSGGYYTVTISSDVHNRGLNPVVQVMEGTTDFDVIMPDRIRITSTGNVSIRVTQTPDNRFNGKIIIL